MGYHTDFNGEIELDKPLRDDHRRYLELFGCTRRIKRNPQLTEQREDPARIAVGLPVGVEGAYFVGGGGSFGQEGTPDVVDYNNAPVGQPGLWCQWVPTADGTAITWDGVEKFYNYVEWMVYIIDHFLKPWGYVANGSIDWEGQESGDIGTIYVKDNKVEAVASEIYNPGPSWDRKVQP